MKRLTDEQLSAMERVNRKLMADPNSSRDLKLVCESNLSALAEVRAGRRLADATEGLLQAIDDEALSGCGSWDEASNALAEFRGNDDAS